MVKQTEYLLQSLLPMYVTLGWLSAQFVRCRIKFKLVLTVATVVARNSYEAMVAATVVTGRVCVWQESGFSLREDVFTCNLFKNETVLILCFELDIQRLFVICSLFNDAFQ
jgi:hypothetical protein